MFVYGIFVCAWQAVFTRLHLLVLTSAQMPLQPLPVQQNGTREIPRLYF